VPAGTVNALRQSEAADAVGEMPQWPVGLRPRVLAALTGRHVVVQGQAEPLL